MEIGIDMDARTAHRKSDMIARLNDAKIARNAMMALRLHPASVGSFSEYTRSLNLIDHEIENYSRIINSPNTVWID